MGKTKTKNREEERNLTVSKTNRRIFGVCGGIAEYYEMKSAFWVRLMFFILIFFDGLGLILYFVLFFYMTRLPTNLNIKVLKKII